MCSQLLPCQLSCLHAGHCSRSCSKENTAEEDGHRRYNCTSPAQAIQDQQSGSDIVVTVGAHDDCHGHWRWCSHTCTDRSGSLGRSWQSPSCQSPLLACSLSCKLLCTVAYSFLFCFLSCMMSCCKQWQTETCSARDKAYHAEAGGVMLQCWVPLEPSQSRPHLSPSLP